jgi:DnaJ-class molecular chaperone
MTATWSWARMWQQIERAKDGREEERWTLAVCPACNGEGEIKGNASKDGDPQADDFKPCSACGGTGVLSAGS